MNVLMFFLIAFIVGLFGAGLGATITLDLLISLEYQFHRESWESDGKPYGLAWKPPEGEREFFHDFGKFRLGTLSWKWFFSTPDWMQDDPKALRLIFLNRVFSSIWFAGWLSLVAIIIIDKSSA